VPAFLRVASQRDFQALLVTFIDVFASSVTRHASSMQHVTIPPVRFRHRASAIAAPDFTLFATVSRDAAGADVLPQVR